MTRRFRESLGLALLLLAVPATITAQGVITTVAGNTYTFTGHGQPALTIPIGRVGVHVDRSGNIFAAATEDNLIYRINTSGILSVVAGNGIAGYSGDGGPAINASIRPGRSMTSDAAGNFYFADFFNYRVRQINSAGIIAAVAGNGVNEISGDGGPALNAGIEFVHGIALDNAGRLLIASSTRVRRVDLSSGVISTIAGGGTSDPGDGGPATAAKLVPRSVAADSSGNIYIAEFTLRRIRRVNAQGIISTFAGTGAFGSTGDGGPATSATLSSPRVVAADAQGNVYIMDSSAGRIRRVNPQGIISTVAGTGVTALGGDGGPATAASFATLLSMAVDFAGAIYVSESNSFRIRKFVPGGVINTVAGNGEYHFSGDGGPAASSLLATPLHAIADAVGNLYIADANNNRIRKVDTSGNISTIAGTGIASFSGNNGPATAATLNYPVNLALDAGGNLYIADYVNHRVRRISSTGVISTFAGTGARGSSGDNGPATSALLNFPAGLAFDAAGNLYIGDQSNHRVRRVTPAGLITTFAGTGIIGFSGDGGQATSATLIAPSGLACDGSGNIYIGDAGNNRVRRVAPNGIITTVAGNGLPGNISPRGCNADGDGGPATAASLCNPASVAVDTAGNLYIADTYNQKIRKVSNGVIIAIAGDGFVDPETALGRYVTDGVPATSTSLSNPWGVAVDLDGNILISDTDNDRVRKVLVARPSIAVTPASLTFTGTDDSTTLPPQSFAVTSPTLSLGWNASASTSSGGNWLTVNPATGSVPGSVTVTPNVSGLTPGTYQGTVTVQSPLATPSVQTANVTLTVQAAPPATLSLNPGSLNFTAQTGTGNPAAQTLRIGSSGRGTVNWTATATTTSGGNWLSLAPTAGTTTSVAPATTQVAVNTAGLPPGVHTGNIQVNGSGGQTITAAVTLILTRTVQTILVSQSGLLFTGVEGGTAAPSQTFGILNVGQGTMSWNAEAITLSGGNWLSVSPVSGSSVANSLQIPTVEVSVNVTGLRAGQYSGLIRVRASGADNTPQAVTVDLNVLPRGSNPGVLVRPTGLIFATQAGTSSPSSQTSSLATPVPGSVDVRGGLLTFDGVNWLDASPRAFRVAPSDPRTLIIQPTLGTLTPAVYRGAVTLLFADGSPSQVVNVLFVVVPQATAGASGAAAPCVPQRLLAVMRSLGGSFSSSVGWPTALEVQVADDCGNPVPRATVVASFSNGDPPLAMTSLGTGLYTASWRPLNTGSQVSLSIRVLAPPLADAQLQVQGAVRDNPNPTAPSVFPGGIVNAASFAKDGTVAPGSIISVFGKNMSAGQGGAVSLPLPVNLAGATLSIAGTDVPLFYSSTGQINAQLPFELAANTRHQVVVKASEFLTVPETVTVAEARPGIFTLNQQGTGQGAILNAAGVLADSSGAAAIGSVVQIFATGLGMTNPTVVSGQPAPGAEPLARVVAPVEVRIGGQIATVQFAGLAPGFVGLYQVNAVVPAGVAPGSGVSVVIVQNGVASNPATIAVR